MKKQSSETGFGAVEAVLILFMVGIIGFVGFRIYQAQNDASLTREASVTDAPVAQVAPIKDSADLDTVSKSLDQTSLDSTSGELDAQLDF
jgi:predicted negative regulator of RcsB-dependent stress response